MAPPDEIPISLAQAEHCFVVAPAGCGKTELIVDAVSESTKRDLVLTHTHAGVQSLRKRFKKKRVSPKLFNVQTLDGWCYKWTNSYPTLCGLDTEVAKLEHPETDWEQIRTCMLRLVETNFFKKSFQLTYGAMYVDEYQDCSQIQHEIVVKLSRLLPTKVVGDPLQKILGFAGAIDWTQSVEGEFEELIVPTQPWRWAGHNEPLGRWLISARTQIENGSLDLNSLPTGVIWENIADPRGLLAKCKAALSLSGTVLIIHNWPQACQKLSKSLKATFKCMEAIDSTELTDFLKSIELTNGIERQKVILQFALECFSTAQGNIIKQYLTRLESNQPISSLRTNIWLKDSLVTFTDDLKGIYLLMRTMEKNLGRNTIHRIELWSEAIKSIEHNFKNNAQLSLCASGLAVRNITRMLGRPHFRTNVSRTLLVKGLEYDHVIIANADALGDSRTNPAKKENLYVALTRARKTLTIFSASRTINL